MLQKYCIKNTSIHVVFAQKERKKDTYRFFVITRYEVANIYENELKVEGMKGLKGYSSYFELMDDEVSPLVVADVA